MSYKQILTTNDIGAGANQVAAGNHNHDSLYPKKDGTGASGTWGINISGNAASASSVAWGNVSGKPSTYTPSSHTHDDRYYTESEINSKLSGKSDTGHTHNYAGSSSPGGTATSANKVANNLTIKLNSGTTEGTNLFTYNGSAVKNINITPAGIGAAASNHTQAYTSSECTTYTSDDNKMGVTPAAVKKAFTIFEPKSHNHDSSYVK